VSDIEGLVHTSKLSSYEELKCCLVTISVVAKFITVEQD